jgi:hypothetical protein
MAASGLFDDELELGWFDSGLDVAKWFDEAMDSAVAASGGTLTASYTNSTAGYNVSTQTVGGLAVADWKVYTGVSTLEQKAGATLISDYTHIGTPDNRTSGGGTQGTVASWTGDGDPTASGSNAVGFREETFSLSSTNGMRFTLAIGASVRKARIYIGRYADTAGADRFSGVFTLSDGSASPVTVNLAGIASDTDGYFELSFNAGSAGQTLQCDIQNNTIGVDEFRTIALRSVWLSVEDTGGGGVTGVGSSSQAQTSAASGSHVIANVTGTATTSQAQTSVATGTHSPAAVTGTATSAQAQTTSASGAFSAGITGALSSSQAQTSNSTGSHTVASVSGVGASSQAQTSAATGSHTVASVSGSGSTSQAQTSSASGAHAPLAVSGTGASSQAQTSAASGAFSTGISSTGISSQAQTTSAEGSHTIAGVTCNVTSSQAQTTVATGSHTVAGVTSSVSSSQAQTTSATGAQTIGVNGVGASSQAQTAASSGSFAIQPVGGVASSSQAQTTASVGNGGGVDAPVFVGGIDLFEAQRRNRRKAKPDNELTEQEAEIKALMQVVISKKTAKSRKAAKLFEIQPLELPKVEIAPKQKTKKTPKTVILDANYISDDEVEIILALMLEMM